MVFRYCRAERTGSRRLLVRQSKTQCVLSPQTDCTVVVGLDGSKCMCVLSVCVCGLVSVFHKQERDSEGWCE